MFYCSPLAKAGFSQIGQDYPAMAVKAVHYVAFIFTRPLYIFSLFIQRPILLHNPSILRLYLLSQSRFRAAFASRMPPPIFRVWYSSISFQTHWVSPYWSLAIKESVNGHKMHESSLALKVLESRAVELDKYTVQKLYGKLSQTYASRIAKTCIKNMIYLFQMYPYAHLAATVAMHI